jgi:hypothetical protein
MARLLVDPPCKRLENNVGQRTMITLTSRRTLALEKLPMEGAILRATPDRTQTSKHTTLPDHLLILRTKVILNRLPTRQESHRRGDTHADGTPVEPACPNCTQHITQLS